MKTLVKITLMLLVFTAFQSCSKDDGPAPEPIAQPEPENGVPVISAQTFMAIENIADNMPIGTVEASDPDNDALTFTISTNANNLFEISETGELSLDDLQTLDFETAQSHDITVAVSDGADTAQATITINVTDVDDTSFITKWVTEFSNETITIITRANEYTYNYTVDWGDGTIQSGRTGDVSHIYDAAGSHTIIISGDFPAINMFPNDDARTQIRSVEQWGTIQWQTMEEAFIAAERLDINATDLPDLSKAESMRAMFAFVRELTVNSSINNWDVSTIMDMGALFSISSFNGDISSWDVSSVTNMGALFNNTPFNGDISNWDVSNVTNMNSLFIDSQFNGDISNWNVSSVNDMSSLFRDSLFNQDISNWDVSSVTDMRFMFENSPFNGDISNWNVGNVVDMEGAFREAIFNGDISNWDVSNVEEMSFMFEDSPFNQDISGWNVENVTSMVRMFQGSTFNQDINTWDVSNVIGMGSMFRNSSFNQDISDWEVVNVVNMIKMFQDSSFNQDISNWNVANVTNCSDFSLNAPLTTANTPNFTNCTQ